MQLGTAQKLIYGEALVNRVDIQIPGFQKLKKLKSFILERFPNIHVQSWKDRFSETLILFQAENRIHGILLVLLALLTGLSVYSSFYLDILRKKRDLRSLILLGYPRKRFSLWLQSCCHLILISSLVGGLFLILVIRWSLEKFPVPLPQSLFYSKSLPFEWEWGFLAVLCLMFYSLAWISLIHAKNRVLDSKAEIKPK